MRNSKASIFYFQIYFKIKIWECVKIFDDGTCNQEHKTNIQIFHYRACIQERASIKTDAVILEYNFPILWRKIQLM